MKTEYLGTYFIRVEKFNSERTLVSRSICRTYEIAMREFKAMITKYKKVDDIYIYVCEKDTLVTVAQALLN
jgi:hypothetical protein